MRFARPPARADRAIDELPAPETVATKTHQSNFSASARLPLVGHPTPGYDEHRKPESQNLSCPVSLMDVRLFFGFFGFFLKVAGCLSATKDLVGAAVNPRRGCTSTMMMGRVTAMVLLTVFFGGSTADAGPYIGSDFVPHKGSAAHCASAAQKILVEGGYNIIFSTSSSIFGEKGENTVLINCQIPSFAILEISSVTAPTLPDAELQTLRSTLAEALGAVSSAPVRTRFARHILPARRTKDASSASAGSSTTGAHTGGIGTTSANGASGNGLSTSTTSANEGAASASSGTSNGN